MATPAWLDDIISAIYYRAGVLVGQRKAVNLSTAFTATDDPANNRINLDVTVEGSRHAIIDEDGATVAAEPAIQFIGDGVAVTDDSGNDRTVVTITQEETVLDGRARGDFLATSLTEPTLQALFLFPLGTKAGGHVRVTYTKTVYDATAEHTTTCKSGVVESTVVFDGTKTWATLPSLGLSTSPKKVVAVGADLVAIAKIGETDPEGAVALVQYTTEGRAVLLGRIDDISGIIDLSYDSDLGVLCVVATGDVGTSYLYTIACAADEFAILGKVRLTDTTATYDDLTLQASCVDAKGTVAAVGGLFGSNSAVVLVDISPPDVPAILGVVGVSASPNSVLFGPDGVHLYAVGTSGANGKIDTIDYSVPASMTLVHTLTSASLTWSHGCRDIAASPRNYLYAAEDATDTLHVVDITTPAVPALSGSVALSGAAEALACCCTNLYYSALDTGNGMGLVDVTTVATPIESAYDVVDVPEAPGRFYCASVVPIELDGTNRCLGVGDNFDQPVQAENVAGTMTLISRAAVPPNVEIWPSGLRAVYLTAFQEPAAVSGTTTTKIDYVAEWMLSAAPTS